METGMHHATREFELACECDRAGLEAEAIPHYRAALAAGLGGAERRSALLGLGSSLRNVGDHEDSVATLEGAVTEFPDYPALRAFLALSLCSAGRAEDATAMALRLALEGAHMDGYERVLAEYCADLER